MSKKEIKKKFEEKIDLNNLPIKTFSFGFDSPSINYLIDLKNELPKECFDWYSLEMSFFDEFIYDNFNKINSIKSCLRINKDDIFKVESDGYIAYFGNNIIVINVTVSKNNNIYGIRRVLFKNKKDLKNFLIKAIYKHEKEEKKEEKETNKKRKEKYNRIFLEGDKKSNLFDEIKEFINSKKLYKDDLNLPWKRSYCLYGPPGNGKTLLIRTIKDYFGLNAHDLINCIKSDGSISIGESIKLDSSFCYSTNNLYNFLFPNKEKPTLYYLEDIDRVIAESPSQDSPSIQTHQLLKALDGVKQKDKYILFITTNEMNNIVEALSARPGRIDRTIDINKPTVKQIKDLINYYDIKIDKEQKVILKLKGKSMAFVKELIKSAKMKFKKKKFKLKELKSIIKRIEEHNKKFGNLNSELGFN